MAHDPSFEDHKAWLGHLQPEGLVVSPTVLVNAQVILEHNAIGLQQNFNEHVGQALVGDEEVPIIENCLRFATEFLQWPAELLLGLTPERPVPDNLTVPLPDVGEILEPSLVFVKPREAGDPPLLLVKLLDTEVDLDTITTGHQSGWSASASQRMERLLRETDVPIGVICNHRYLRLMYAPRGESVGTLTWPVEHMTGVAGRKAVAALHMLLSAGRLLTGPTEARLPRLLELSREYQSQVSTALAGQVLEALYELLRGFQAADRETHGELLRDALADDPQTIYAGLLTVLMRLVFLLFTEDRGLMPASPLYVHNYSVHGLFEDLQADVKRHPDNMGQRFGAWARLASLFGAVYDGCRHAELDLPRREGHLFKPERYPFLVGDTLAEPTLPLVPDGCIATVLDKLLRLKGERLSYRTLDVEEIGSVYQTIMGFDLKRVESWSIAIKGQAKRGEVPAPVVISLEDLLAVKGAERAKWLKEHTGRDWKGNIATAVRGATSVDELLAALDSGGGNNSRIARFATPDKVAPGWLVLQPNDERRRTGSHYTPRKLTSPIVGKTLEPVLAQLGEHPTPEQILDLKVCDPAMGSGAFLVEACRQLADALVEAWHHHGLTPDIPPDEDELLHARRLAAQRCLYGVDKNPMAVDLAKLSLWLATLAKDHPFTFVDHSLRAGDSLVGLTRAQIAGFTWETPGALVFGQEEIAKRIEQATTERRAILEGGDLLTPAAKLDKLRRADDALDRVRFVGDLVVAAFFAGSKPKERAERRDAYLKDLLALYDGKVEPLVRLTEAQAALGAGEHPVAPFHWEIEFPEVFGGRAPGFDAMVGNPPFLGGLRVSNILGMPMFGYLTEAYPGAGHLCDLVAFFFRRSFDLLRPRGVFGLLATNTVAQGDTRVGGLAWLVQNGGVILAARKRLHWPGEAAVVVSVVHMAKGQGLTPERAWLDGEPVSIITAYLLCTGSSAEPSRLAGLGALFSQGTNIRSPGFLVGDDGEATTNAEIDEIIAAEPWSASRVLDYLGGEEVNVDPLQRPRRRVIYLSDIETESELGRWPGLRRLVEQRVRPEREALGPNPNNDRLRREWWAYHADRSGFYKRIDAIGTVLVQSQVSPHLAFAFQPSGRIWGNTLNLFLLSTRSGFAVVQSRSHEGWARFFGSTLEERLRYTPSDCFETFPFPPNWEQSAALESIGQTYYDFRAELMVDLWQGLTKTYNLFHMPNPLPTLRQLWASRAANPDWRAEAKVPDDITPGTRYPTPEAAAHAVTRLRELHTEMDRAVLDAYDWTDIPVTCGFGLDYLDDDLPEAAQALVPATGPWWPDADSAIAFAAARGGTARLPWRYRWPEEVRDEVLARLLALNAQRAEEERLAGLAADGSTRGNKAQAKDLGGMFSESGDE